MASFTTIWPHLATFAAAAIGLIAIWLGLRGLLSGRAGMLGRMQGFRLMVFGLVLVGLSIAFTWQLRWLILLSLGIGLVEILESSTLIAVWKWGRRREARQSGWPRIGVTAR